MNKKDTVYIQCDTHGKQPAAYVCQHIVEGLINKSRVGFFWSTENSDNPYPDAWCSECNNRVGLTGGEWVGEASKHLGVKVLCGECYNLAKRFHMGETPWS